MVQRNSGNQRDDFHRLVELYGTMVYRLAYRLLKNQADAEDVAQDVFTKYVQVRLETAIENPRAWLCVATLNMTRNAIRNEHNRRRREDRWAERSRRDPAQVDSNGTGEDTMRSEVWEAVDALPDDLRIPIVLHYQEGFKYREIAEITQCPPGTVSTRISLAKQKIRALLSRNGVVSDERNRTSPSGRS